MCHRRKGFPRYDDIKHIDSAAVIPEDEKKSDKPGSDPGATRYTEEYLACGKEKERHCKGKKI